MHVFIAENCCVSSYTSSREVRMHRVIHMTFCIYIIPILMCLYTCIHTERWVFPMQSSNYATLSVSVTKLKFLEALHSSEYLPYICKVRCVMPNGRASQCLVKSLSLSLSLSLSVSHSLTPSLQVSALMFHHYTSMSGSLQALLMKICQRVQQISKYQYLLSLLSI